MPVSYAVQIPNSPQVFAALKNKAENEGFLNTTSWNNNCYLYLAKTNSSTQSMHILESDIVPNLNWVVMVGKPESDGRIPTSVTRASFFRPIVDKLVNLWALRQIALIKGLVWAKDMYILRIGLLSVGNNTRSIVVELELIDSDDHERVILIKSELFRFITGCLDEDTALKVFSPQPESKFVNTKVDSISIDEYLKLDHEATKNEYIQARLGHGGFTRSHQAYQHYKLISSHFK